MNVPILFKNPDSSGNNVPTNNFALRWWENPFHYCRIRFSERIYYAKKRFFKPIVWILWHIPWLIEGKPRLLWSEKEWKEACAQWTAEEQNEREWLDRPVDDEWEHDYYDLRAEEWG